MALVQLNFLDLPTRLQRLFSVLVARGMGSGNGNAKFSGTREVQFVLMMTDTSDLIGLCVC